MSWADDLNRLTKKGGEDLGELSKAIKIAMFSSVVLRTRVGDPTHWKSPAPKDYVGGRLRGNWQIQENSPAKGELERIDKNGDAVMAEINAKSTERGNTFFVNNLPYAKKYEELDAMVATSISKVKNNIAKMARDIKK